ncbi:MAG: tetratricopeptide repeat protein [Verrucomicrobiota bacterium]
MASTPEVPVAHLEFEHSPLEDAIIRHKSKLILVGALAVVGTLAYFGNKLWVDHKDSAAALAFTRAQTVGELREAAAKNPGLPGAGSALIEAARLLAKEGKGREAIEELEKFIAGYPAHELLSLAKFRLADLKLQEGGLQDAADRFLEIAKDPKSPFTPLALVRAGDIRWQEGKTGEASQLYQQAVTVSGGNQAAMQRLKQVKLVPPTLIDYVPEPTPPPGIPGLSGIPGLNNAPPSAGVLNGGINTPGLLGDDPAAGLEAPLLPPPAIPGVPPMITAPVVPAPTPPPAVPTPPPAVETPATPPPAAPAPTPPPAAPVTPPAVETPAAPVVPTPPPAVETPAAPATPPAVEVPAAPVVPTPPPVVKTPSAPPAVPAPETPAAPEPAPAK